MLPPPAFTDLPRPSETGLDLRGGNLPAVPDEDIYPGYADRDLQLLVYRDFMRGGDLQEVAAGFGVARRTALKWAQVGRWVSERRKVEDTAAEAERLDIQNLRLEKRLPELKAQIETGVRLRKRIDELLDDEDREWTPGHLMQLGTAVKAAGDNMFRTLGVNEAGATGGAEDLEDGKKAGKAPLVVVVQGGGLPQVRRSQPSQSSQSGAGPVVIDV
jgi:hypothetical protein